MTRYNLPLLAALLTPALPVLGQNATVDFGDYGAPVTIISGSATGNSGRGSTNAALIDSANASIFSVYGATGSPNAGTTTTYSATVLDGGSQNYLRLRSTRNDFGTPTGGNPVAQVSTTNSYALAHTWGTSMTFSLSSVPDLSGSGAVYMGLYAGSAMTSNGGYTLDQIANGNAPVMGIQMAVNANGSISVMRTGSGNVMQYFTGGAWSNSSGTALGNNTFDFTGNTRYNLSLSVDAVSGILSLSLLNLNTSTSLLSISTAIADLGSNITNDGTLRFSAGDIGSNTTFNYDMNVYSLTAVPEPTWTAALLAGGITGIVILRRRRRNKGA